MRKATRRASDLAALGLTLAAILLVWPHRALALDPAVGLGHYQHAAICGSAPNSASFGSMAFDF